MSSFFTHIDSTVLEKEISAINEQIKVFEQKRDHIQRLLDLSMSWNSTSKVVAPEPMRGVYLMPSLPLRERVTSLLASEGAKPIKELATTLAAGKTGHKDIANLKAALYTVFNRNKEMFQNRDGKWALSEHARSKYLLSGSTAS